jgi:trk system potassium uptake protein TrkH
VILLLAFSRHTSWGNASWWGIFHSVSAFNNAGFDLQGEFRSVTAYQQDWPALVPLAGLIILGSISYTVIADVAGRRSWRRLSVDTKLILSTSAMLLLVGTGMWLVTEAANPATLGPLAWPDKVLNAAFHSVSLRTAGFNAVPLSELREQTLFFNMALMFIGGASGSTAGGIKVQTFSLLFFAILASIRGSEYVVAFGREIPQGLVYRALSIALLAVAMVFAVALILTITEPFNFTDVFFEAVSAFGTVGLSTGITPELSIWGRLVLIGTMFVGRLGPLTLVLALAARAERPNYRYASGTCKIG